MNNNNIIFREGKLIMKKNLLLIFAVFFIVPNICSQTYFSSYEKKICDYNNKTGKYDDCSEKEYNTLFKMNKAETMIEHTTPDLKSSYYVNDKKYNDSISLYMYMVTSDVGNKYIFVFDIDAKEIRVLGESKETGNYYIITWYIKKMWTEE